MFDYRIPPVKGTDSVVDSLTVFKESFHKETQHLNGLDWKGLFAAGGSVLAALLPATDDKGIYLLKKSILIYHQCFNLVILIYFYVE